MWRIYINGFFLHKNRNRCENVEKTVSDVVNSWPHTQRLIRRFGMARFKRAYLSFRLLGMHAPDLTGPDLSVSLHCREVWNGAVLLISKFPWKRFFCSYKNRALSVQNFRQDEIP